MTTFYRASTVRTLPPAHPAPAKPTLTPARASYIRSVTCLPDIPAEINYGDPDQRTAYIALVRESVAKMRARAPFVRAFGLPRPMCGGDSYYTLSVVHDHGWFLENGFGL